MKVWLRHQRRCLYWRDSLWLWPPKSLFRSRVKTDHLCHSKTRFKIGRLSRLFRFTRKWHEETVHAFRNCIYLYFVTLFSLTDWIDVDLGWWLRKWSKRGISGNTDSDIKRKINGKDTATTHQENSCMLKEPSLEFELGIITNHCEVDSLRFSMNLNRVVRPSTWQAI